MAQARTSRKPKPSHAAAVSVPNDVAELLPEFKVMLQATNRSPRTIGAYIAGVEALRAFLVERGMPSAVDAIASTQTTMGADGGMSRPVTPPTIKKVTVRP